MYLKRSAFLGLLGAMCIAGACTASQDSKDSPQQNQQASSEKAPENEMVEITIRMPDGRVIVRKEPKAASRIDPSHPILQGERPAIVTKAANDGTINTLSSGVTGGSNSAIPTTGSASGGGGSSSAGGGGGGGGGGSQSYGAGSNGAGDLNNWVYTPPPSVQPDNDYTTRIYAWRNTGAPFRNVITTYMASPRRTTPAELAQSIADAVLADRPEHIAIRFWDELDPAVRYPLDISNPRELIIAGGFTQGLHEYWGEFARELKDLGIEPDYLIHDFEKSIRLTYIPQEEREYYFGELMDRVRPHIQMLPISMQGVSVDQITDARSPEGRAARIDYNQFAAELRAKILSDVFNQAFQAAYGKYIPISNYRDINPTFHLDSYSGWPFSIATVGGISAPVVYLESRPDFGRYRNTQKHRRWNRLIDGLNACRSTATNGLVTPWISAPGYGRYGPDSWARPTELTGEYRIWEIMMDHMLAMGIDTFILWNPSERYNPNAVVTDAFVDQWLAENPRGAGPQLRNLPEIPLDADSITTNGVTTTYQDFLDALNSQ